MKGMRKFGNENAYQSSTVKWVTEKNMEYDEPIINA